MPAIYTFGCSKCDFSLPFGWGGIMYVIDDDGKRIICKHPGEHGTVYSVIGDDATDEEYRARTGFLSDCFCPECLNQFKLDLKRDARACVKCNSTKLKSVKESVGTPCPICADGIIIRIINSSFVGKFQAVYLLLSKCNFWHNSPRM